MSWEAWVVTTPLPQTVYLVQPEILKCEKHGMVFGDDNHRV